MTHGTILAASSSAAPDPSAFQSVMQWFNITEPWEFWWLVFGLLGQAVFTGRWVLQWIASEKRRDSHVPEIFWWSSLLGATMLLAYFVGKRDLVGILGQLLGWTIYSRNLWLIRTRHKRIIEDVPGPSDTAAV